MAGSEVFSNMSGGPNSIRGCTRPFSRAVHKNGWLKKLPDKAKYFKKVEQQWYCFCIHNQTEAFLETYDNRKSAKDHKPLSILPLIHCQHISPSIVLNFPDFAFTIILNDKSVQLAATTREQMMDWIRIMKAKLQDLGILKPKENPYSKSPVSRAISDEDLGDQSPPLPPRSYERHLSLNSFLINPLDPVLSTSDQTIPPLLPPPPPPPRDKYPRQLSTSLSLDFSLRCEDSIPPPLPPPRDSTSQIKTIILPSKQLSVDPHSSSSQGVTASVSQDSFFTENNKPDQEPSNPPPLVEKRKSIKKCAKPLPPLPLEDIECSLSETGEIGNNCKNKDGDLPPPIPPKNYSRHSSTLLENDQVLNIDSFGEEWDRTEIWTDAVTPSNQRDTILVANGQENISDNLQYEAIFIGPNPTMPLSPTFQNPNYEKSIYSENCIRVVPPIPPRRFLSSQVSVSEEQFQQPNIGPPVEEGPPPYESWTSDIENTIQVIASTSSSQNVNRNSQRTSECDINRPLSLKEVQTMRLKQEIVHRSGVRIQLSRRDCWDSIALVDCFGYVWIAGWKQKEFPHLHNAFHLGDKILSVNNYKVTSAQDVIKLIKMDTTSMIEFIVRRVPHGKVFSIKRDYDGQDLGIVREGNTAKIKFIEANSLAARHGLHSKPKTMDGSGTCSWVLTEINHRPLSWFFKENEVQERLGAVGKDIPILVQPSDLTRALKKSLKSLRNYKEFIVQ